MKIGGVKTPFIDIIVRNGKVTKTLRIDLFELLEKQTQIPIKKLKAIASSDNIDIQLTDGLNLPEPEALELSVEEKVQTKDKFGG